MLELMFIGGGSAAPVLVFSGQVEFLYITIANVKVFSGQVEFLYKEV